MNSVLDALLVLEDGTKFLGSAVGFMGSAVGEVIFNTSMTGYQEIITDPSYFRQIVALTYPHIGNVGTNELDAESSKVYLEALIVRDLSLISSNFRSHENLSSYLKRHNIVAIADIDTRKLTRIIRKNGAQRGCIITGNNLNKKLAQKKALNCPSLCGVDLAKEVSTLIPYTWSIPRDNSKTKQDLNLKFHVVIYDFGTKRSILRMLVDRGCYLTVIPAQTPAEEVLKINPDGILLSNGPGDPEPCHYAIKAVQTFLNTTNIPIFGICFGHQLLALATGAKRIKMKFGHHGANHPVKDIKNNIVMITSQNHCFTVDENSLPACLHITHRSLFDGSVQGIHHNYKPAFSFQGHPEGNPGPHDASVLLDHFIELIKHYNFEYKQNQLTYR